MAMKPHMGAVLLAAALGGMAGLDPVDALNERRYRVVPSRRGTPKRNRPNDEIRQQRNKNKAAKKSRVKNKKGR